MQSQLAKATNCLQKYSYSPYTENLTMVHACKQPKTGGGNEASNWLQTSERLADLKTMRGVKSIPCPIFGQLKLEHNKYKVA